MKTRGHARAQRRGVILIVVLAMLTLFAIVGITFTLVSDVARPANRPFQRDVEDLSADTRELAFFLGQVLADDIDDVEGAYSAFRDDLGRLSARAAEIRARVQQAYDQTEDRAARADLKLLGRHLDGYLDLVCQLRKYLEILIQWR